MDLEKNKRLNSFKKIVINLSLALLVILIFLVLFEIFLAVFMPMGNPLWAYDEKIGINMVRDKCSRHISSEYNVEICTNNLGFRDLKRDIIKPDDTFRIVLLGDSFVAAREVEFNKTFGQILETKLNNISSKNIEIINLGVGGQGTGGQLLTSIYYGTKLDPDLIILNMFLENDIVNNYPNLEDRDYVPLFKIDQNDKLEYIPFKPAPIISNPILNFISQNLLSNTFSLAGKSYRQISNRFKSNEKVPIYYYTYLDNYSDDFLTAWKIEDKLIGMLAKDVKNNNADFFIITFFSRDQITDFKFLKEKYPNNLDIDLFDPYLPIRKINPILNKHKISYFHMYPLMKNGSFEKPEELFFPIDGHWNEEGHILAADLIYNSLLENNLIPLSS